MRTAEMAMVIGQVGAKIVHLETRADDISALERLDNGRSRTAMEARRRRWRSRVGEPDGDPKQDRPTARDRQASTDGYQLPTPGDAGRGQTRWLSP